MLGKFQNTVKTTLGFLLLAYAPVRPAYLGQSNNKARAEMDRIIWAMAACCKSFYTVI